MLKRLFGRWVRRRPGQFVAEVEPEDPPGFRHVPVEIRLRVDPRPGALPGPMTIIQMDCRYLELQTRYSGAFGDWAELFRTVDGLVLESRVKP